MFANTSDWRFDRPGENNYVQFIDRATEGDIDDAMYEQRLAPVKALSDKWWQYTVAKFGGALPASMCKYWGELMGLRHGSVRPPLSDLDDEEKAQLKAELEAVQSAVPRAGKRLNDMILMVSVQNLDEAMHALKGGADIVDVKNLQEALVGSANPWVVEQIRDAIPEPHHASVTLGVVPNQIGTVRHGRLRRRTHGRHLRQGRLHEHRV